MIFDRFRKKRLKEKIDVNNLPRHLAVIMDGNGRWAKQRGLPRTAGHNEGGKSLLRVLGACHELGIQALTVYAFSTENWKRPKEEVDYLMTLPGQYIDKYLPLLKERNIRVNFIGHLEQLSDEMKENMNKAIRETKDNTGLIFTIALNYGSRSELIEAIKHISNKVKDGKLSVDAIDEATIDQHLMTSDLPPIDLMIRTSGEVRISNFLLWQLAYSELYFTKVKWPDFHEAQLYRAILNYQQRHRRYGGL